MVGRNIVCIQDIPKLSDEVAECRVCPKYGKLTHAKRYIFSQCCHLLDINVFTIFLAYFFGFGFAR